MENTILIIEDDKDILDMMTYILNDDGFRVVTSLDVVSLTYLKELNPSLILLDNRLTEGFGRDLCIKIKSDNFTRHFPVILVSAVKELAQIAAESGANAYLYKPFDLEELVSLVRRFVVN